MVPRRSSAAPEQGGESGAVTRARELPLLRLTNSVGPSSARLLRPRSSMKHVRSGRAQHTSTRRDRLGLRSLG